MADTAGEWKRIWEKAVEKVADSFVSWLLGLVAVSGVVVGAKAYLHELAPAIAAYASRFGPWVLTAGLALLVLATGLRARAMKRQMAKSLATHDQRVAEAVAYAREQFASELRAQWTEDRSLTSFGLEPTDAWCFVHEAESTWTVHMAVRAWSAIPYPAAVTVVEATFAVDDGKKVIASLNPRLSWSPLGQGLNEPVRISASISTEAAHLIRAASRGGCVGLLKDGTPPLQKHAPLPASA